MKVILFFFKRIYSVMEYVDPGMRTIVGNVPLAVFLTLGASSLPWIAYWLADWRLFSIVTSAPIGIMVIAWWIVPESARWLVLKGKTDRTLKILRQCAATNKMVVDQAVYDEFQVHFFLFLSIYTVCFLFVDSQSIVMEIVLDDFS